MTSLKRFKERLRGEHVKEELQELSLYIQSEVEIEDTIAEPAAKETEHVSIVDVAESAIEDVIEDEETVEMSKLESMTKVEIDGYAADHGIQLDRRQTKFNMITEFIQKIEEKN